MKILVVEKDYTTALLISARMRARGYEIHTSQSSQEALSFLEQNDVQLAMISSDMERVEGEHLIEKIRKRPQFSNLPVIMLTEEKNIADLVLSQERGFDDFLVKPFSPLVLQLRVYLNIVRVRQRIEANALTFLPGNATIERVIRQKIERGEKFSVLYMDINHFKSFNDRYGFDKGDAVIRQTATILKRVAERVCRDQECFVGHVGGDDFIVVLSPDKEENYAKTFIEEFDRIMPTYYNEADQKRGFVRVLNRQGKRENLPLMSCSVAACTNQYHAYQSLGEIARDAAQLKSFLKSQEGSHYLRDRRATPIDNIEEVMHVLEPSQKKTKVKDDANGHPLGQVLREAGLISEEQLAAALKIHLNTGQRLGQILISMNAVRSQDVGRMLEKKLNIPYVSLKGYKPSRDMSRLFTWEFIKSHRVVALKSNGEGLKLAMCDPFDLKTLDAIERITRLKPIPHLALEDEFHEFVERYTASLPESKEENL